jgi:hypothetical protein
MNAPDIIRHILANKEFIFNVKANDLNDFQQRINGFCIYNNYEFEIKGKSIIIKQSIRSAGSLNVDPS